MKKFMVVMVMALFVAALLSGCGEKAEKDTGKVPPEVKKAESIDSTRMDSAMMDTAMMDTGMVDSTMIEGGE